MLPSRITSVWFSFAAVPMPSITRTTEKGLPRYLDDIESDVFMFSGAEDLVPELLPGGQRHADSGRDAP